jgi:hypothetical protein
MLFGIRTLAVLAALVAAQAAATQEFAWSVGSNEIVRLKAPTGFHVQRRSYVEGMLTELHYPDGAYIVLQCGGMYRIPMFQATERIPKSSTESEKKTIRRGQFADSELLWREDNYKLGKVNGERSGLQERYPPNVAYDKVPPDRRAEFDAALDSFQWEIDKAGGSGR